MMMEERREDPMTYDDRPWLKSYDKFVNPDLLAPEISFNDLIEQSFSEFASRPAMHFMGKSFSFAELDQCSRRFAAFLHEAGCGPGDVVGINLPNTPQYLFAHAGALRAGCAVTGVSPLLTAKEMAYQLNDSGTKVLVCMDSIFAERLLKIKDKVPKLTHVVATNVADFLPWIMRTLGKALKKVPYGKVGPIPGKTVLTFPELLEKYPAKAPKPQAKPDDTCLIQYTGGTTGLPKGTELSHKNIVNNIFQSTQWFETERGGEVYMSGFPFFHLAGLFFGMSAMANGNAQVLVPDPRNTAQMCKDFAKFRPTVMANVPSLYQMLLNQPLFKGLDFSCLRGFISGAAPLAEETVRKLEQAGGVGNVLEVYGMTETSPLMTMNPYKGMKKVGSVGLPLQSTYVKMIDLETGTREVPFGEAGELIVRGPQVMKGYFNKPEETAHALREFQGQHWLHTGDIACMNEDGYITIMDRAKDMLNVGGYKVFSREVEESLCSLPVIEFCAIIGLPNPERPGTEIVKAVIQLAADSKAKDRDGLKKEILSYCRENMAPYKIPKVIEFIENIPLTAVGKVDKKALR
jgi:long-chain acyl-CoA synthetase